MKYRYHSLEKRQKYISNKIRLMMHEKKGRSRAQIIAIAHEMWRRGKGH